MGAGMRNYDYRIVKTPMRSWAYDPLPGSRVVLGLACRAALFYPSVYEIIWAMGGWVGLGVG